jgi:hypothetical protein
MLYLKSSSLSPLQSLLNAEEFSPRHTQIITALDALFALETEEGSFAVRAYLDAMPKLQKQKFQNEVKYQISVCNRNDYRYAFIVLFNAMQ